MVDTQNHYFVLLPIFMVLLFIIPKFFMKWMQRQKPTDSSGNLIANYNILYHLITPKINPITCTAIFGNMKELDSVFPEQKLLSPEDTTKILKLYTES